MNVPTKAQLRGSNDDLLIVAELFMEYIRCNGKEAHFDEWLAEKNKGKA